MGSELTSVLGVPSFNPDFEKGNSRKRGGKADATGGDDGVGI